MSTSTSNAVSTTGGLALPAPGEPWDLLYVGFEDVFTRLPAELYAERASAALGVEVRMTHPSGFEHLYVSNQLQHVRGMRFPPLDEAVREAEIIVLLTRPDPDDEGPMGHINKDFLRCSWGITAGDAPEDRPPDYWDAYRALIDEIYDEIWLLRQGLPTLIIAIDFGPLDTAAWVEAGIEQECLTWWAAWSNQIREAATANGATMVSAFELFHGPNHDLNPVELGLATPTNEGPGRPAYRTSPQGAEVLADALTAVGFEPIRQP